MKKDDAMKLTSAQLEQFDRDGYLFFPSLFTPEEIKVLIDEVPALYAQRRPENVREKGSDAVRTNFAAHMYSAPFARLARHPRMVTPVVQVFGEPVYMHQFKINGKMAFDGDVWQWHQDFGTWFNDDQMPEARAMNVAIFLDEVNEFNGPLMFIPGSHKLGVLDAGHDTTTTSYPLWTIDHATITRLIELVDERTLVLIDEPELSLSVPWQRRFLRDIRNGDFCAGLIAVTHSPFIYDNELREYAHSLGEFMAN